MKTELEAVNFLLTVIGVPPVGTLDDDLPVDVASCRHRLNEEVENLQKGDYLFNKNIRQTLTPNDSGFIEVGHDTLKVVPYGLSNVTLRGTKLFDNETGGYEFCGPVIADVHVKLAWDELPATARDAAMYTAAVVLCDVELEDYNKAQRMQPYAVQALISLNQQDIAQRNLNVLNSPQASRVRSHYRNRRGFNPMRPGGR